MPEMKAALLKGLIYSVCFWVVYRALNSLFYPQPLPDAQAQSQAEEYARQVKKSGELLQVTEKQQFRMDAILTKQEEQARRLDEVIKNWEKAKK